MDPKQKDKLIDLSKYEFVNKISESAFSTSNLVKSKEDSKRYILHTIKLSDTADNDDNNEQKAKINNVICTLSRFNHSTINKFIGYSDHDLDGKENSSILTEYEINGSLSELFKNEQKYDIQNTNRQIILIGIVRSMMLLSKYNIINVNLNPENILLDENFFPHLINFSMIQFNAYKGTIYTAPEIFQSQKFGKKSDVYSFSLIMYQILTSNEPFIELKKLSNFQINRKIIENYRSKFPESFNESLKELIEQCWSGDPEKRPSFETIFFKLAYDKNFYLENVDENEINKYIDSIKDDIILCTICHEKIEKEDLVYFSTHSYHKHCVKCSICGKQDDQNDFVCVTPNLFFCNQHYKEIEETKQIPQEKVSEYKEQILDKIIDDSFDPPSFNIDNITDYKADDIFIDLEMIEHSFEMNQPFEYFFPSVKFHFEKPPEKINIVEFKKMLYEMFGDEAIIYCVEKRSTILKIAFLSLIENSEIAQKIRKKVSVLKDKLKSAFGISIVGNFTEKPTIKIPDDDDIKKFYNQQSNRLFQTINSLDIKHKEIKEIKEKIISKVKRKEINKDIEFVFENADLYKEAEEEIQKQIENNKFEMVIKSQTIYANKYLDEYNKIKQKIKEEDCEELFLYHGTQYTNHKHIFNEHFYAPNDPNKKSNDEGYFGKGIYATDDMFYALFYANDKKYLKFNEVSNVILCKAIFNQNKANLIEDMSQHGLPLTKDTTENYGINYALIGDKNNSYYPIKEDEKDENFVSAYEFVFPNKYQIIPVASYAIKRMENCVIWKDENIAKNKNAEYLNYFKKHIEENIYSADSIEKGLKIVEKKKHIAIKLITNGGKKIDSKNSGQIFIEKVRNIIQSNFVCLVFAIDDGHLDWISKMENVLFTTSPKDFKEFVEMKMMKNNILEFANKLNEKYHNKLNVNKDSMLEFPLSNMEEYVQRIRISKSKSRYKK